MNSESRTFFALGSSIVLGLVLLWLGYKRFYCRKKLGKRAVVKELYLYPVKSCAGIKLDKVEIEKVGPLLDRTWVLVNSKGIFQSMRQRPKLALVKPSFEGTKHLCIDAPGMPTLKLNIDVSDDDKAEKRMLDIFALHGEGFDCGDEAGQWFDTFLGKPGHRLFNGRSENLKHRILKEDEDWADSVEEGDQMIFPDVCPIMMVSEASLEAVNGELENPVDIRSFRPNIFIEGCLPFEEDAWSSVKIGDVLLRKLRHCSRCILTTVDMDKGIKRANGEPLKTLMRIRVFKDQDKRYNQKPLFGNLFVADVTGTINVGDDVTVLA